MEYGLWNLQSGLWQTGNQSSIPVDQITRQYYAPATGLPPAVFHPNATVSEAELPLYSVTGSHSYRHQTEYLIKNGSANSGMLATIHDDKNSLDNLGMGGDLMEPRSLESLPSDSVNQQLTASPVSASLEDRRKLRIKHEPHDDANGQPLKPDPTIDYLKQQSFQHPMYGMIFSQMAKPSPMSEPDEDEEGHSQSQPPSAPSLYNENSLSAPRSPESMDAATSRAGYECGECGFVAETRLTLKKHIALSHPDPQMADDMLRKISSVPNTCPMASCRFRTSDRNEMEAHVTRHVSEGFNPNGKKKNCPVALQRVRYEREEYRCQMCAYSCTIEKAFYKHLKIHSIGVQGGQGIKISCVICGRDRSSEVEMNKHMKKHRDDRYFCCDICIFKTFQLKKLIQHRRMHTGEKPHLCPHCSYRSARRDNLRSHVRRVHKKENLYCDTFNPRGVLLSSSASTAPSSSPAPSHQDMQE